MGLMALVAAMARVTAGLRWPPDTPPLPDSQICQILSE